MRSMLSAAVSLAAALLAAGPTLAQPTVKVGLIMTYSGQFADAATQMDNGVKLYVKQHGDTVASKKLEFIRRDTGGIAPDVAKRLAQELVVRDGVDILSGWMATPNTLAGADVSAEARKFMPVMNGAGTIIPTKSPYIARVSFTLPQSAGALATWAATKGGVKKAYTMVSDFSPGHEAEQEFLRAFKEAGGEIIGSVRFPVANPDFSAFVQRAKDVNPEAIFIFVPGGIQPAALGKAFHERGVDPRKTKILGSGEVTTEQALKSMGDAGLGIITAWHYDYNLNSALNNAFVKAYKEAYGRNPDFFSVGGYDGMHLIYEALKKTGGKTDAGALMAAARGMSWDSPRGPMSIDPETRDVVQTIYIRRVEKVAGELVNVVIDKVENVKDPVKARMKK